MKRYLATVCIAAALCLTGSVLAMATTASASTPAARPHNSPMATVHAYFQALNTGFESGDVSAVAALYAPQATLVVSTPNGVTTQYQGLASITGWLKDFTAAHHGLHLTRVSTRRPLPNMVIDYERAGTASDPLTGRCSHVFAMYQGKIVSDDFIIFYGK